MLKLLEDKFRENERSMRRAFRKHDVKKSGRVGRKGFSDAINTLGLSIPTDQIDRIFKAIDRSRSGTIDHADFMNYFGSRMDFIQKVRDVAYSLVFLEKLGEGSTWWIELIGSECTPICETIIDDYLNCPNYMRMFWKNIIYNKWSAFVIFGILKLILRDTHRLRWLILKFESIGVPTPFIDRYYEEGHEIRSNKLW